MKKYVLLAIGILLLVTLYVTHTPATFGQALRTLIPTQGGTGISSVTAGDIGKCLRVLLSSPFTFNLDTCGSGASSHTSSSTPSRFQYGNGSTTISVRQSSDFVLSTTTNASLRLFRGSSHSLFGSGSSSPSMATSTYVFEDFKAYTTRWRVYDKGTVSFSPGQMNVTSPAGDEILAIRSLWSNILYGYDTIEFDVNFNGNTVTTAADTPALRWSQGGTKFIVLTNFATNGVNGWQHIRIPLSYFTANGDAAIGSAGTGTTLDTKATVTELIVRVFNNSANQSISFKNIVLSDSTHTLVEDFTQPNLLNSPKLGNAQWRIQGLDFMKISKDNVASQTTDKQMQRKLDAVKPLNLTHIAISTPYDETGYAFTPAPQYAQRWADAIHGNGYNVFWRQHPNAWEGDYSFTKVISNLGTATSTLNGSNTTSVLSQIYRYIINHSKQYAPGDIITPMAEPENGGISGVVSACTTDCQFYSTNRFRGWLRDAITVTNAALDRIGLKGRVYVGFYGNSGFVVWGNSPTSTGTLDDRTVDAMKIVTADHYVNPVTGLPADLGQYERIYGQRPLIITEYGTTNQSATSTRQQALDFYLKTLESKPYVYGFNYWNEGGSNEALLDGSYHPIGAYATLQQHYTSGKPLTVATALGTSFGNFPVDISSSTPTQYGQLLTFQGNHFSSSSIAIWQNATTTFPTALTVTSTATSSFSGGINITGGCYGNKGACIATTTPWITVCKSGCQFLTDGVGDDAEIQAAVDYANANLNIGAVVHLMSQVYNVSTSTVLKQGVRIEGEGDGTVIQVPNGFNKNVFTTNHGSSYTYFVQFRNLRIEGNKANNTSGNCIYGWGAHTWVIQNVHTVNCADHGVYLIGDVSHNALNNWIRDNRFENSANAGLLIGAFAPNNHIIGNIIGGTVAQPCMDIQNAENYIGDNHMHTCGTAGISLSGAADNNNIIGNYAENAGGTGTYGIDGSNSSADGNRIIGNTIFNNNNDGIIIGGQMNTLADNRIFDRQGSKTQDYGINLNSTSKSNNVSGNQLVGNLAGPFIDSGTYNRLVDNGTTTTATIRENTQFQNASTTFSGDVHHTGRIFASSTATSTLTGGLAINSLNIGHIRGCNGSNTIKTDSSGSFICTTDATGGGSGLPNLIYRTLNSTKYYTASSTASDNNAFHFNNGFISSGASSTITDDLRLLGKINASSTIYDSASGTSTFVGGLTASQLVTTKGVKLNGDGSETIVNDKAVKFTGTTSSAVDDSWIKSSGDGTFLFLPGSHSLTKIRLGDDSGNYPFGVTGSDFAYKWQVNSLGNVIQTGKVMSSSTAYFSGAGTSTFVGGLSTKSLAATNGLTLTGGVINDTGTGTSTFTGGIFADNLRTNLPSCSGTSALNTDSLGAIVCGTVTDVDSGGSGTNDWQVLNSNSTKYQTGSTTNYALLARTGFISHGSTTLSGWNMFTGKVFASSSILSAGSFTESASSTFKNLLTLTGKVFASSSILSGGSLTETASSTFKNYLNVAKSFNASSTAHISGALTISAAGGSTPNLVISGSGEQTFRLYNTVGSGSTRVSWKLANRNDADWTWIMYTDSPNNGTDDWQLANKAGTVLFADTNRQVGFSSTTPAQLLSVSGSGYLTGGLGVGNATTTSGVLETSGSAQVGGLLKVTGAGTSTIANGLSITGGGLNFALPSCNGTSALQTDAGGGVVCGVVTDTDNAGSGTNDWQVLTSNSTKYQTGSTTNYALLARTGFISHGSTTFSGWNTFTGKVFASSTITQTNTSSTTPNAFTGASYAFTGIASSTNFMKLTAPKGASYGSASILATEGLLNLTNTNNDGPALQIYTNHGAGMFSAQMIIQNDNTALDEGLLRLNQAGTAGGAYNIRMDGPAPQIEMVETDQVAPAGKFEFGVNGDQFYLSGRNAANNSFEDTFRLDRLANGGAETLYGTGTSTINGGWYVKGGIGSGTSSPAYRLSVNGNTYLTGGLGVGNATTTSGVLETSGIVYTGGVLKVAGLGTSTLPSISVARGATAGYFTATSTTATSTYYGAIKIKTLSELANPTLEFTTGQTTADWTKTAIIADGQANWKQADLRFVLNSDASNVNYTMATDTKMILKNNGSLGIGTTTPAQQLSVLRSGYIVGGLGIGNATTTAGVLETSGLAYIGNLINVRGTTGTSTFASGVKISKTTGFSPSLTVVMDSSQATEPAIFARNNTNWAQSGSLVLFRLMNGTDSGSILKLENSGTGNYITADSVLALTKGGNLGIGTTSPSELLSVQSASNGTSTLMLGTGAPAATNRGSCLQMYTGKGVAYRVYLNNAGTLTASAGACKTSH